MKQHMVERLLYVTLASVFLLASILITLQLQSNERLQKQNDVLQSQVAGQKEVLKGVQELLANQGKTTDDINKSLSCILIFFSTPNHANYYISNLTTCTMTSTSSGRTQKLVVPSQQDNQKVAPSAHTLQPPITSTLTPAPKSQPKPLLLCLPIFNICF